MKKLILLVFMAIVLILTTNNTALAHANFEVLVKNQTRDVVFNEFENIALMKGYRVKTRKPSAGILQIHLGTSELPSPLDKIPQSLFFVMVTDKIDWHFAVQVTQEGDDVSIIGHCFGGLDAGRGFRRIMRVMKRRHYDIGIYKRVFISKFYDPDEPASSKDVDIKDPYDMFEEAQWVGFIKLNDDTILNTEIFFDDNELYLILDNKKYHCEEVDLMDDNFHMIIFYNNKNYVLNGELDHDRYSGTITNPDKEKVGNFTIEKLLDIEDARKTQFENPETKDQNIFQK